MDEEKEKTRQNQRVLSFLELPRTSSNGALVEVGGVEPPSENLSIKASTCVVGVCFSRPSNPADRALDSQPIGFRPADPGPGSAGLACLYDALISPGKRSEEDVAAS